MSEELKIDNYFGRPLKDEFIEDLKETYSKDTRFVLERVETIENFAKKREKAVLDKVLGKISKLYGGKADEDIPDNKEDAYNLGCSDMKIDIKDEIQQMKEN